MGERFIGTVIWFGKVYGFIARDGHDDLFVHYSDIASEGFKTLQKNQKVEFSLGVNREGRPKAVDVIVVVSDE